MAPLLGVLAASCGQPLVSGSAYESPMMLLKGFLVPFPVAGLVSPRVNVIWVDPLGVNTDVPASPPTLQVEPNSPGFRDEAGFEMRFFAPPPVAMIRTVETVQGGQTAAFAFGELVLYEDREGAGELAVTSANDIIAPNDYRGAGDIDVVLFVAQPLTAPAGPLEFQSVLSSGAGFHLGRVDCTNASGPLFVNEDDLNHVAVRVLTASSQQLPYPRSCLHSHPPPPFTGP